MGEGPISTIAWSSPLFYKNHGINEYLREVLLYLYVYIVCATHMHHDYGTTGQL